MQKHPRACYSIICLLDSFKSPAWIARGAVKASPSARRRSTPQGQLLMSPIQGDTSLAGTLPLQGHWSFWDGLLISLCLPKLPLPRDSFAEDSAMRCLHLFHACTVPLCGYVHITWGSFCEEGSEAKLLPKNCFRAISSTTLKINSPAKCVLCVLPLSSTCKHTQAHACVFK